MPYKTRGGGILHRAEMGRSMLRPYKGNDTGPSSRTVDVEADDMECRRKVAATKPGGMKWRGRQPWRGESI